MAFSGVEEEVSAGQASALSKGWRRALSPRTLIILAAVAIGALAGLISRATSEWTGFGVGFGLFTLLAIFGTPYLFGPLSSPAEIRRIQAELAEQARREADAV
jgi:hypothetical protein